MTRILLFALLSFVSSIAWAQDSEQHLVEADALVLEGDYDGALAAYKRYLIFEPVSPKADKVRLRIAWIHYISERPKDAEIALRPVVGQGGDDVDALWARLRLGQVLISSEAAASGRNGLERLLADCKASQIPECVEISTAARLALADYFAGVLQFEAAASQLAQVPGEATIAKDAYRVSDYVRTLETPSKNAALAGVLSAVPGAGHLYIEEYPVAIVALLANVLLIGATVDAAVHEEWGQAALFGALELVVYSATIYDAVTGAEEYNLKAKHAVRDGLRKDIESIDDDSPWSMGLTDVPSVKLRFTF